MSTNYSQLSNSNILIIGDIILDHYNYCTAKRISPEAPVPVVEIVDSEYKLGGAANVALNISMLEIKTKLIGIIGEDTSGTKIKNLLQYNQIDYDLLVQEHITTTTKTRILTQNHHLLRIDQEKYACPTKTSFTDIEKKFVKSLKNADAVIISDYNKGCLKKCSTLIKHAKLYNKPIIVDPKGKDFAKYAGASIITPNIHEFEIIAGTCTNLKDIFNKATNIIKTLNIEAMLITLGEKGMFLITKSGFSQHLEAVSKEVFDVTGAGDTVAAVLAAYLTIGCNYLEAAKIANIAAGVVVEKSGTTAIKISELQQKLYENNQKIKGSVTLTQLLGLLAIEKLYSSKIVFTNGCFDILHAGHIKYLQEAKLLGNKLIVAINTDASIKKIKGENRPINSLKKRIAIVAELKSVDWVISFDQETPEQCIKKIKPDILVKGSDYDTNNIVGADFVKSYGGAIKTIDLLKGNSTTGIIKKCLAKSL